MKKTFALLMLTLLAFACKNDSKKEAAAPLTDAAAPAVAAPSVDISQSGTVLENARITLEDVKSLRKQIDALPDAVKKAKAEEVESLRSTLEGLEEKEAMYIEQLNNALSAKDAPAASSDAAPGLSPEREAAIKEATESLARYAEALKELKEQASKLSKQ